MCGSMADIQSAAAEIRRGKKKKEQTTAPKYNGLSALFYRATIIMLVLMPKEAHATKCCLMFL